MEAPGEDTESKKSSPGTYPVCRAAWYIWHQPGALPPDSFPAGTSGFSERFCRRTFGDSENDLYSKSAAKDLVFAANCAGCAFVGRPLVEGTRTLSNYTIVSNNLGTDLMGAYRESAAGLVKEVLGTDCVRKKCPKVLVLHASSHKTSNTYAIWNRVKEQLPEMEIREIGLRNGTLSDWRRMPVQDVPAFWRAGKLLLRWSDGRGRLSRQSARRMRS